MIIYDNVTHDICVYVITNYDHDELYVGSTLDGRGRALRHKRELKYKIHDNWKLQRFYNKRHGPLHFYAVFKGTFDECRDYEQHVLDNWLGSKRLLNIAKDARYAGKSFKPSVKHKAMLRAANLGRPKSEEHRQAIRNTLTGHITSEETKAKQRAANLGKKFTVPHKTKISLALKGKPKSAEARRKMAESGRIKIFTDAHRASLSKSSSRLGKPMPEDNKKKLIESNYKPISIDNVIYNSTSEAMSTLGLTRSIVEKRLSKSNYPTWKRIKND